MYVCLAHLCDSFFSSRLLSLVNGYSFHCEKMHILSFENKREKSFYISLQVTQSTNRLIRKWLHNINYVDQSWFANDAILILLLTVFITAWLRIVSNTNVITISMWLIVLWLNKVFLYGEKSFNTLKNIKNCRSFSYNIIISRFFFSSVVSLEIMIHDFIHSLNI